MKDVGKRRPSFERHLQHQTNAEGRNLKRGSYREKVESPKKKKQQYHPEQEGSYHQYLTSGKPAAGELESKLLVLLKPEESHVQFRKHVKLHAERTTSHVAEEAIRDAATAKATLGTISGMHPHSCRININGTNTEVDAVFELETDTLTTSLKIEFHDIEHKVLLRLDATVHLGQAAIKEYEENLKELKKKEQDCELLLEVWRKNEEVREARHREILQKEEQRAKDASEAQLELEAIRWRECERERELKVLQERDENREIERERERSAERAQEKLRLQEREYFRLRELEREQERYRERNRERDRQEELAQKENEAKQIAMERQLREEERQQEKEKELQRKFEEQKEKERDIQWRAEVQRLLRMQRVCLSCEKQKMEQEFEIVEQQTREAEETQQKKLLQEEQEEEARCATKRVKQEELLFDVSPVTKTIFFSQGNEMPCLLFTDVFLALPPSTGRIVVHMDINSGYEPGDKLDVATEGCLESISAMALKKGKGNGCITLEHRQAGNHVGIMVHCQPDIVNGAGAVRIVCPDSDEEAVKAVLRALCFLTTSDVCVEKLVTITLEAEVDVECKGSAEIKKSVQMRIVVMTPAITACKQRNYLEGAMVLLKDVTIAAPEAVSETCENFNGEMRIEIRPGAGWTEHNTLGYGLPDDPQEDVKRKKKTKQPYTVCKGGAVYFEGTKIAKVIENGLSQSQSQSEQGDRDTVLLVSTPTKQNLEALLSRIWFASSSMEIESKHISVTLHALDGDRSWHTTLVVMIRMIVAEPSCKFDCAHTSLSYRLFNPTHLDVQHSPSWLCLFADIKLEDVTEPDEIIDQHFIGGHIEVVLISGSKKGDELAFRTSIHDFDPNTGSIIAGGVEIAKLDAQGLLGTKYVKIVFSKEESASLSLAESIIRSLFFRNPSLDHTNTCGARCIGLYVSFGNKNLELQMPLNVGLPLLTVKPTPIEQGQIGRPMNVADADGFTLLVEPCSFADTIMRFKVLDEDPSDLLEPVRGQDEFIFKSACKDEMLLEDGITLSDWDCEEWTEVKAVIYARRDDFIALAYMRPGELLLRLRKDIMEWNTPRPPRTMRDSVSSTSSRASTISSMNSRPSSSHPGGGSICSTASSRVKVKVVQGAPKGASLREETTALLANILYSPGTSPDSKLNKVLSVTLHDSMGGVTTVFRKLTLAPYPTPCISMSTNHVFRQSCFNYNSERWHGEEGSDEQHHSFCAGAVISPEIVPNKAANWKYIAEVVSGHDTRDSLVLGTPTSGDVAIDHKKGTIAMNGTQVATYHARGSSLLVSFNTYATRDVMQQIVRLTMFSDVKEPMLVGQRKVQLTLQKKDEELCSLYVMVDVMPSLLCGPAELGVIYALESGYSTFLRRFTIGVADTETFTKGKVRVAILGAPSKTDEIGFLKENVTWFMDKQGFLYSAMRKICKVVLSRHAMDITFCEGATGADLRELLSKVYYACWSREPRTPTKRLCVDVTDGTAMQHSIVTIALEPTNELISVTLSTEVVDFMLRGDPLPVVVSARVIPPGGNKVAGHYNLVAALLTGYTNFDSLSLVLSNTFENGLRMCESKNIWYKDSAGEVKIGHLDAKTKLADTRTISIRLDSPPARALEAILAMLYYHCTRPNLRDRGTSRHVQIMLKPIGQGSKLAVKKVIEVRLVGPLLDVATCFPRKYAGEPLALLSIVQVSRNCFATGTLNAYFNTCDETLEVAVTDVLLIKVVEESAVTYKEGHFYSKNTGVAVASVAQDTEQQIVITFYDTPPRESTSIMRAVCYTCTEKEPSYVSVSINIDVTDQYGNVCSSVVKIDS